MMAKSHFYIFTFCFHGVSDFIRREIEWNRPRRCDQECVISLFSHFPLGPLNFTMFLTLFGEKLNGTDPEDVIKNAFACFDFAATGWCLKIFSNYPREV